MKITKTIDGTAAMLSLSGWLDSNAAPALSAELDALNGVTDLVLDLDGLEYISSSGLRQIVRAHKLMNGKGSCSLIRVPQEIEDVFRMTGLFGRLNILS